MLGQNGPQRLTPPFPGQMRTVKWNFKGPLLEQSDEEITILPDRSHGTNLSRENRAKNIERCQVKLYYLRLSHDAAAEDALQLITDVWNLKLPKLLIEVTGGSDDFHLHPKLCRQFRKSIVKVAATTGAWILTGGTHTGVMKYVGEALRDHARRSRNKIVAIGIAPWGIVENRDTLVDEVGTATANKVKSYRVTSSVDSDGSPLDPNHTHFILVDNGTVNKYGVEFNFRSRLEKLISEQPLFPGSDQTVPIVCLVLEGGIDTIKVVLQNVSQNPPIPIVVVEGSGRAADLIAYALSNTSTNGQLVRLRERERERGGDVEREVETVRGGESES
ncbi:putative transient receptor potential cation channel subfamily M member 6 [Apostichopus japonicus]|uniref:Putative transient receptor potential cation channel subfamily M member 6 n=1 Tax=Stichopus japonicus TaxID=307972 RepID=A0A2G8LMS1_STIJA|nr:putative transient receptor potential cation channel subfamily M member 6 [Apostichopus japonicus]WDP79904.1 transient receptor potential cation channel subfamily M member 6 [Apostichopus japonicus]